MKYYILFFVVLGSQALKAQEYSPNRWKETQRLNSINQKDIAYTDTLFLTYNGGEEMGIRKGGFVYNGKVSQNKLNLGHIAFDVLSNTANEIKLAKDSNIHIFTRVLLDKSASDAPAKIKENVLPTNVVSSIDFNLLKGEWEAYKRVSRSGPLPKVDFNLLIKKAIFYDGVQNEISGVFYATTKENYLYAVTQSENGTLISNTKEGKTIVLKVFLADGKELIVEDQYGVLYFMRKFQK